MIIAFSTQKVMKCQKFQNGLVRAFLQDCNAASVLDRLKLAGSPDHTLHFVRFDKRIKLLGSANTVSNGTVSRP